MIGHGMLATATMGRLRAAIQTLADLELEPDEVLARIADLVQRLVAEAPPDHHDVIGATCLYAIYDPVTQRCAIASAGHLPPSWSGLTGPPKSSGSRRGHHSPSAACRTRPP